MDGDTRPGPDEIQHALDRLELLTGRKLRGDVDPEGHERGVGRAITFKDARALAWINVFRSAHCLDPREVPLEIPNSCVFPQTSMHCWGALAATRRREAVSEPRSATMSRDK